MNRGIHCLIESLSNFTRIQLVPPEQQEYYVGRFNENKRIIDRVADDDTKKAMQILGENMKKIIKIFPKTLDKPSSMWYNKYRKRERDNPQEKGTNNNDDH